MPKGKASLEELGAGRSGVFGHPPLPKAASAPNESQGGWMFAGYVPYRRGILEHVQKGKLNKTDFAVYSLILLLADHQSGVWWGSAKALGAYNYPRTTARRSLERLSKNGYIRRFLTPGKHSNYPILINKYAITSGEHKGKLIDAKHTTNPDSPVFTVEQVAAIVPNGGSKMDKLVAPSQEVRSNNKKGEEEKKEKLLIEPRNLYNIWQEEAVGLPKLRILTDERKQRCRILLRKNNTPGFITAFRKAIRKASETPFLRGENDTGWRATFDWMTKADKWALVLEGNYDDSGKRTSGSKAQQRQDRTIEAAQRVVRDLGGGDGGSGGGVQSGANPRARQNLLPGAGK